MFIFVTVIFFVAGTSTARPNIGIDTQNVITVPPNCSAGQEWINGACRDIWRTATPAPSNIVTVPVNCPSGQEWVNGACREVWRAGDAITAAPSNIVTVPVNCPSGQEWVNGACREVWRAGNAVTAAPINIVTVPVNCPSGQEWVNGACRDVWRAGKAVTAAPSNIVTVPVNCPEGQEYVNGQCRDVWFKIAHGQKYLGSPNAVGTLFKNLKNILIRHERQIDGAVGTNGSVDRNIINVPNQCPAGYKPDALGVCRPILF